MRAVIQRVQSAQVRVEGIAGGDARVTGAIGAGLLVFAGVEKGDTAADVAYIAGKVRDLRIFEDAGEKMNLSIADTAGAVLVVSQFTLLGDTRRSRRPSFDDAEAPAIAKPLYAALVEALRASGLSVETGEFQAHMLVEIVNDGPVTILLDSRRRF